MTITSVLLTFIHSDSPWISAGARCSCTVLWWWAEQPQCTWTGVSNVKLLNINIQVTFYDYFDKYDDREVLDMWDYTTMKSNLVWQGNKRISWGDAVWSVLQKISGILTLLLIPLRYSISDTIYQNIGRELVSFRYKNVKAPYGQKQYPSWTSKTKAIRWSSHSPPHIIAQQV